MEKFIELLNEWSKTAIKNKCNWTEVYDEEGVYFINLFDRDMTMEMEDVISKRNGFIKWLVENNKIDYQKSPGEIMFDDLMGTTFSLEDSIVMMLSISDTPIEDLISYLR